MCKISSNVGVTFPSNHSMTQIIIKLLYNTTFNNSFGKIKTGTFQYPMQSQFAAHTKLRIICVLI